MNKRLRTFSLGGGKLYVGPNLAGGNCLWMDVGSHVGISATPRNLRTKAEQLRRFAAYLESVANGHPL